MESRLAGLISIADVCAAVRVCPRTLGYSFEEVLGISPSRYLMSIRLSRVRRELLSLGNELSVQSIAARWGFWHMGRFARYYRDTFGERPSDTIRARGGARRRGLATPTLRTAPQ
jgi:AraC family ethanolamine operon transcriptional activator